jgi:glucose/arabinose dehydrogenase
MSRFLLAAIAISLFAIAACDGGQPPSSPPPSSAGETVTGRERLGWSQPAENPADAATYQYAVYVDGGRRVLEGVTCVPSSGTAADCTAPLPSLTPGAHTLQIAAFLMFGDEVIEGPRSTALQVTVMGVVAAAAVEIPESGTFVSSDGLRLVADVLARDLDDPADLAVDHQQRVFIAERHRGIRIVYPIDIAPREPTLIPIVDRDDRVTLHSLALDADFDRSRAVYVAYAAAENERPVLRVARFREAGGQLAERAVITQQPVENVEASALIRFAPDGALFVAMAAESNPDDAQRLASPAGKVLRLRADGSTPDDNPAGSPVFSYGHRDPRGFAWHVRGLLWEVERGDASDEMNVLQAGGNYGWPLEMRDIDRLDIRQPWRRPRMTLTPGTESSGLTTIRTAEHAMDGDLIVSAAGARDLLRIRLTPDGQRQQDSPARLLKGRFGRIGQVTAAPDGTLYFITANREEWGAGSDMLVRLRVR